MFSISTTWNSETTSSVEKILAGIKKAGFDTIEVGHNFSSKKLDELALLTKIIDIKVVSVHNYCPVPPRPKSKRHKTDYYRISSLDEEERQKAVEFTKGTIDTARRLKAGTIVIHAGTVELEPEYVDELMRLYREGKSSSEGCVELKDRFLKLRASKRGPHIDAAFKSMEEILKYAIGGNIKVGLETRYYPNEIPNYDEIGYFLKSFVNKGLYYWHDVGHAEVNERLGITSHDAFLTSYSKYMLGMHIHDLIGIDDHKIPFKGDFDFSKISKYLTDDLLKVIEAHSESALEDMDEAGISKRLREGLRQ